MPVISACRDLFPDPDCPWTLVEISDRLLYIETGMNYDRVYRAWRCLCRDPVTRALAAPLGTSRPLRFGSEAARRIARQSLSRRTKKRLVEMATSGTAQASGAAPPSDLSTQK